MGEISGVSKGGRIGRYTTGRRRSIVGLLVVVITTVMPVGAGVAVERAGGAVPVIIRETDPASDAAEALVRGLGGEVGDPLGLIGGFTATVPSDAVWYLAAHPATVAVTPDASLQLLGRKSKPLSTRDETETPSEIIKALDVDAYWRAGLTGVGVDVALIDSGVSPVNGLTRPGKVVDGPDISFESQQPDRLHLDSFGHGTHMAGIIAGWDDGATLPGGANDATEAYYGVAPGARIVSVKVAGRNGVVDVSQVIAAIDWVVQHRRDNGLNIRVLNLSFGTDSGQDYVLDPLSYAVEQAWHKGIVVVVAAGNDGNGEALRNPATNPYVIAVGAVDTKGTTRTGDDRLMSFSNCGVGRQVDLVAPGKSVIGLANPTSTAGIQHPEAMVGGRFIKGSGTSQAAAVVSGLAALIIGERPSITPDAVKQLLMDGSRDLYRVSSECEGAGLPSMSTIRGLSTPKVKQPWPKATGLGSLHEARGSFIVSYDGVDLTGEVDIMGQTWDPETWAKLSCLGQAWTGGEWNGATWSGATWSSATWSGLSWTGATWSGLSWTGLSWTGLSWSGLSWTGATWSRASWSGDVWS